MDLMVVRGLSLRVRVRVTGTLISMTILEGNGLFTSHIGKFIYLLIISRYYIVSIEEEFSHKHINKHSHLYFTQLEFYIYIYTMPYSSRRGIVYSLYHSLHI